MGLITPGLAKYQQKKRRESEEKILLFLLNNAEINGVRQIWKMTRIYKNNIRPILDKLISENKILKFDNILIHEYYEDQQNYLHKRNVKRTVYVPNLKNEYIFNLIKTKLPKLFIASNRKWCQKGAKLFLEIYKKHYKWTNIEHAIILERGTYLNYDVKNGPDELEIMYAWSLGTSLCLALHLTKQIPKKIPNLTQLEKLLKTDLKIKKRKRLS